MPAHKFETLADRIEKNKRNFRRGFGVFAKKVFAVGVIGSLLFPYGYFDIFVRQAEAGSKTLSTSIDWQVGEYNRVESGSSYDNLRLTADGNWEPRVIEAPEWGLGYPSTYVSDGKYIYVLRASGDNEFYRYLPENDEWRNLTPAPYYHT